MTHDSNSTDVMETAKTEAVAQAKARQAAAKKAEGKKQPKAKPKKAAISKNATKLITARTDSKQARFIAAMRTARGISIDEAAAEFGWQKHTVRGAMAGAIKKRLGLKVEAEQDEKRGTVYRIAK